MKLIGRRTQDDNISRGVTGDVIVEMTGDEYRAVCALVGKGPITMAVVEEWEGAKYSVRAAAKALGLRVVDKEET